MASNIKIATTTRNAQVDAITTAVGTSGLIKIYDGTQPANPGTAVSTQTLLVTLTCSSTFAAGASSGVLTANTITGANAVASSTATWYRLSTSGSTGVV